MPFSIDTVNNLILECPFRYPLINPTIEEKLRYRVGEEQRRFFIWYVEIDKKEVIVHRYERIGDHDIELPPPVQVDGNRWFVTNSEGVVVYEALLAEGQSPPEKVQMRGEYVYEWLDRVLAGPLPVTEGGDDMRLVTATRFYEKWPHHINLLKEMESQIRAFADPNARRQTELMIALSGT